MIGTNQGRQLVSVQTASCGYMYGTGWSLLVPGFSVSQLGTLDGVGLRAHVAVEDVSEQLIASFPRHWDWAVARFYPHLQELPTSNLNLKFLGCKLPFIKSDEYCYCRDESKAINDDIRESINTLQRSHGLPYAVKLPGLQGYRNPVVDAFSARGRRLYFYTGQCVINMYRNVGYWIVYETVLSSLGRDGEVTLFVRCASCALQSLST